MEPHQPNPIGGALQLLFLLAVLAPAIFFLLAQQKTLKTILPENRLMRPGLVWLQLIPVFNFFWQYYVVLRISGSISKQLASGDDNSILGLPDPSALEHADQRPTFAIGITWCTTFLILVCCDLFATYDPSDRGWLELFPFICSLATLVCWIIYWIQLHGYRKLLSRPL